MNNKYNKSTNNNKEVEEAILQRDLELNKPKGKPAIVLGLNSVIEIEIL